MQQITIAQLKSFERDPKTRHLRTRLRAAQNDAERIRSHVDEYTRPIFERFTFYADRIERRERITRPSDLYLSADEEQVAAYYAARDEAHKAHGYNLKPGYCPALIAEHEVIEAENELMGHFRSHLPAFPEVYRTEDRQALLDLITDSPVSPVSV